MRHFLGFVQNIHQINPHDSNGKQGDTEKCQQYEHQGSPAFHGNTVEEIANQEKDSKCHTDQKTADAEITYQKQRECGVGSDIVKQVSDQTAERITAFPVGSCIMMHRYIDDTVGT